MGPAVTPSSAQGLPRNRVSQRVSIPVSGTLQTVPSTVTALTNYGPNTLPFTVIPEHRSHQTPALPQGHRPFLPAGLSLGWAVQGHTGTPGLGNRGQSLQGGHSKIRPALLWESHALASVTPAQYSDSNWLNHPRAKWDQKQPSPLGAPLQRLSPSRQPSSSSPHFLLMRLCPWRLIESWCVAMVTWPNLNPMGWKSSSLGSLASCSSPSLVLRLY